VDQFTGQQIASGETIYTGMGFPFFFIKEESILLTCFQICHTYGMLLPICIDCGVLLTALHIVEHPHCSLDFCTFYLLGMCSILGDDLHCMSDTLAFFKGTRACQVSLENSFKFKHIF
jgi:hypothetical protein